MPDIKEASHYKERPDSDSKQSRQRNLEDKLDCSKESFY